MVSLQGELRILVSVSFSRLYYLKSPTSRFRLLWASQTWNIYFLKAGLILPPSLNDLSFRMWLSSKTVSQKKPVNGESWVERFGRMQDVGVEVGRHWFKTNQGQGAFPQNMLVGQKAWIESHKCSNMTKILSSLNCICATMIYTGAIWQCIAIYSHSSNQYIIYPLEFPLHLGVRRATYKSVFPGSFCSNPWGYEIAFCSGVKKRGQEMHLLVILWLVCQESKCIL